MFSIILALVIVGVILWLVNDFIPMDPRIKNILNIVVIIVVVLWLIRAIMGMGVIPPGWY